MAKKRTIIIPVDEKEPIRVEELDFADIQKLIALPGEERGHIQCVGLPRRMGNFYMNDNAKLSRQPPPENTRATKLALDLAIGLAPDDFFVGVVCIAGPPDTHGNTMHVPTQVINAVVK